MNPEHIGTNNIKSDILVDSAFNFWNETLQISLDLTLNKSYYLCQPRMR